MKEHRGYRVRRELRELVLFAWHDLLKDSPFSRLDLISCRNLLIYLNRDAQQRALEIFHFALNPDGRLFLGVSESVDEGSDLFTTLDKKYRIYAPRPAMRTALPVPTGVSMLVRSLQEKERGAHRPAIPHASHSEAALPSGWHHSEPAAVQGATWGELHVRIFEQLGPPSMIVDQQHNIVHLSEAAGRYLKFGAGELTKNLMRAVHPMLRIELRAAIYRATQSRQPAEAVDIPIDVDGQRQSVDIRVSPADEIAPDYLLIVLNPRTAAPAGDSIPQSETDPIARQLERELEGLKSQMRDVVEQNEAAVEEQKAGNEELQAMNEELRSATEELETSREELQSINEELTTVNQELKSKVDELGRANSDLRNLMNATAIAIVFLDRELCITRYTPSATALFNLIPTDIGRPLTDLKHRLDYSSLERDAADVLGNLVPIQREVGAVDGGWFLARLLPYRTADDHIAGVVLTLVDITDRKMAEEALSQSEERFRRAIVDSPIPLMMHAEDGEILQISRTWTELTGYTDKDIPTLDAWLSRAYSFDAEKVRDQVKQLLTGELELLETEIEIVRRSGERRLCAFRASVPGRLRDGRCFTVVMALDITKRKEAEDALRASEERLHLLVESALDFAIFTMDETAIITSWNSGAEAHFRYTAAEIMGQSATLLCSPEDRAVRLLEKEMVIASHEGRSANDRWHCRKDGTRFWGSGSLVPLRADAAPGDHKASGFLMILSDRTEAREAEQALEQGRQQLWEALQDARQARNEAEAAIRSKDHFLAVLSHELRTPLTPILMAIHSLKRMADLPAPVKETHEMIKRNVQLEVNMIDQLFDMTKIVNRKVELIRESVDLHECANRATEISLCDIQAKGQTLTVALEAQEHRVLGDGARLQQALWNLIKNASKFTPDGGEITVTSRNEDGKIVIEVADSGIGMEEAMVEKIFAPFEQGEESIAREFGGLGLGLAIARATIEAHGGKLSAGSRGPGKGSTFTIALQHL